MVDPVGVLDEESLGAGERVGVEEEGDGEGEEREDRGAEGSRPAGWSVGEERGGECRDEEDEDSWRAQQVRETLEGGAAETRTEAWRMGKCKW